MANDAKFNFYLNRQGPRGQKGEKGDPGFSPSITVNTDTADEYTLLIQNEYDSFVTDNIRPTYDDRGGTYVRVDRSNNVQYFGSADIATTANYGEVKLAQASDLASTVDVGNSNVITVELLKTWFDGQLADNLVTTTNNVTIQGQKIFATPTRFMDTVRIGNRLMVTQEDTGTITFDSNETGTLIGSHLTSTGDARFMQNVTVDGTATIEGQLSVKETPLFYKSIDVADRVYAGGITILSGDIEVNGDINATGHNTITKNVILSPGALKRVNGFSSNLRTDTSEITPEEYITVGDERLPLRLVGTKVLANGKDVATADTVNSIQSDLNIAKQDIIEAQGDIDNLQMNKQNKLTAGSGITIDADNVISATGGVVDIPIASSTTLGGIKVGENLTISEDGTLSATGGGTGDVSAAGNNTFTGENTFNGAVNLNGISTAENLTVTGNLTSNGEINAVSIKTTGLRSDDIQTTTNKKYLTEADVDNQTIQVVGGKLHANLDELGNEVNTLSGEVAGLSGDVTTLQNNMNSKQDKLTAISPVNIATKVLSPTVGWTVSSSSMQSIYKERVVNNGSSLYGDNTTMQLTSDSEYPIKSYVAMPYSVGQIVKYRQNRNDGTLTTLVLGDIIDGKIYPILINSAIGNYRPQYTTALFDGTQELTKEVMTNGISYSSVEDNGPINQPFINEATFGCLQNAGTKLIWHVFTPRNNNHGDYGNVTYTNLNGYTIDDLVGKIKYAIILAGSNSLVYTPDQFGVYENTLSSYSDISNYQALSPNLFDMSKNEVQTQITTLPATISSLGVVKPDGTTITITDDGTISAVGGGTPSDAPILDVPVNNCVLAIPTAPTFDGTNVKVYAGTKVAIPNGLNADGTCKSNIVTLTADATINQSTFNGDVTLMLKSDGTIDQTAYSYFEVDDISTITTLTADCWYYDRKTNNHYLASSTGAKQGPYQRIKIGSYNQAEAATIKYFKTYKPIALEKLDITGSCMPDYSAGVTFTKNADHIAPCDGVVLIFANLYAVAGGSCYMTINGVRLNTDMGGNSAGTYSLYFPVAKGDTYNWTDVSVGNNNNYTFYPLKGAK